MPAPDHPAAKGHVLAVDDCETMRELLRASLESLGYRVQLADSGWAALDAAREDSFDAIVLDVEMPGLDGMAVGRALRDDPRTATAPIAMHSSIREDAVRAGFDRYDAFVPKNGDPFTLGHCVDDLIQRRQVRRPAS